MNAYQLNSEIGENVRRAGVVGVRILSQTVATRLSNAPASLTGHLNERPRHNHLEVGRVLEHIGRRPATAAKEGTHLVNKQPDTRILSILVGVTFERRPDLFRLDGARARPEGRATFSVRCASRRSKSEIPVYGTTSNTKISASCGAFVAVLT
jgi:hypothetical protein